MKRNPNSIFLPVVITSHILVIYGTSPIGNTLPVTKTTVYNNRVRGLYCKLRKEFLPLGFMAQARSTHA